MRARVDQVIERDLGRCRYCGCQTNSGYAQDQQTIDHVRPRSRGGTNHVGNLVVACRQCNHRKADRLPDEAGMPLLDARTLVVFRRNRKQAAS